MPRQVRRIRPDQWPQIQDDDGPRPATEQEMLNAGVAVVGRTADGTAIVDCAAPDERRRAALPGELIAEGLSDSRWARMPAGPEKRACHRARVIRSRDGSDLRSACNAAAARLLEPRVPARGSKSAAPADPPGALEVLAEARRRVEAEEAEVIEVAMSEVDDGDVVEEDGIRPHRWLGEATD